MLRRSASASSPALGLSALVAAATATAGAALPAAPAHAAATTPPPHHAVFDIKTSATGTLKVHYHREDPNSPEMEDETYNLDFSYEADYQDVRFVDGRFVDTGVRPIQDGTVTLHDATVVERWASGLGDSYSCVDPEIALDGQGQIVNDDFGSDVSTPMVWRPAERVGVGVHCHKGSPFAWHQGWDLTQPGGEGRKDVGQGPIDLRWDVPYEVLRMDHFEQLVQQEPFQKDVEMCPGYLLDKTITCELTWSGKVVMDRVHEGGGGAPIPVEDGNGDDVIDVPPPTPTPPVATSTPPAPPTPTPAPPVAAGPRSTPTPTLGTARLSRDRKHVAFTVACPKASATPCSGTASAPGARRAVRFAVRPGARQTVTLTLRRAARRGARTTVRVTLGGGATRTLKA